MKTATTTFKFSKAEFKKLEPPAKGRVTYKDSVTKGLQLRHSSSGIIAFSVFGWVKGDSKPERRTIGQYPAVSIEQARAEAAKFNGLIASGVNPNDKLRSRRAELTLRELFEMYMQRHSRPRKRTYKEDESKFNQYLTNNSDGLNLASKKLSMIGRSDIAKLHIKIGDTHPTTANRVLSLVSSIFGRAIEWGEWHTNPVIGIRKFREKSRDRFIQADEMQRFFEALTEEPNKIIRNFFKILLLTGVRRENALAMRWEEVNLDRREWRIPVTKNGEPQTVMLTDPAIEVLKECEADKKSEWVFPGSGASGHLVEPKKGWERLLSRANISDLRIHDLRRTFGSWQAITGASTVIIGKSLNHISQAATAVYAHLDNDPVRFSIDQATNAMLAAAGITSPVGVSDDATPKPG